MRLSPALFLAAAISTACTSSPLSTDSELTAATTPPVEWDLRGLHSADLDGDGVDELVASAVTHGQHRLGVYSVSLNSRAPIHDVPLPVTHDPVRGRVAIQSHGQHVFVAHETPSRKLRVVAYVFARQGLGLVDEIELVNDCGSGCFPALATGQVLPDGSTSILVAFRSADRRAVVLGAMRPDFPLIRPKRWAAIDAECNWTRNTQPSCRPSIAAGRFSRGNQDDIVVQYEEVTASGPGTRQWSLRWSEDQRSLTPLNRHFDRGPVPRAGGRYEPARYALPIVAVQTRDGVSQVVRLHRELTHSGHSERAALYLDAFRLNDRGKFLRVGRRGLSLGAYEQDFYRVDLTAVRWNVGSEAVATVLTSPSATVLRVDEPTGMVGDAALPFNDGARQPRLARMGSNDELLLMSVLQENQRAVYSRSTEPTPRFDFHGAPGVETRVPLRPATLGYQVSIRAASRSQWVRDVEIAWPQGNCGVHITHHNQEQGVVAHFVRQGNERPLGIFRDRPIEGEWMLVPVDCDGQMNGAVGLLVTGEE